MKIKYVNSLMLALSFISLISATKQKPKAETNVNVQIVSHSSNQRKEKSHFISEALADAPKLVINKITPNEGIRNYNNLLDEYEKSINDLNESASIEDCKINNKLIAERKKQLDDKKNMMIEEKKYLQTKRNEIQDSDFKYEHIFIKSLNTPALDKQRIEMIRYIEHQKKLMSEAINLVNSAKTVEEVNRISVSQFTKSYQTKEIMALKNKKLEELANNQ